MTSAKYPRKEIEQICMDYLRQYHGLRCGKREILDEPFTGRTINLSGSDLYRMLMWLEDRFQVYITFEKVREEGFRTINEAVELLKSILEEKNEEDTYV